MADAAVDPEFPLRKIASATSSDLSGLRPALVENVLTQALPLPDIMFGGSVLVFVIMTHAFWMRFITRTFAERSSALLQQHGSMWRVDLLFIAMVMMLLALHLAEVMIWSAALVFGDIVDTWSSAAYFAANCYTALGEPFSLPRSWRIVAPIIGMSGIFAFAWTASVLVNFVARYDALRSGVLAPASPARARATLDGNIDDHA